MKTLFLLIGMLLHMLVFAQSQEYYKEFRELELKDRTLVFQDSFKKDWQKQWFKDGEISKAIHRNGGLELYAGDEAYNDAHHTVLWTKNEFEGDIMIEYDFTRLDSSEYHFVNIIYILATGSDIGKYSEDI